MDAVAQRRKDLKYDPAFWDPMRELREAVDGMPWYPMNVNNDGQMVQIMGKGKRLNYPDGWSVQYCIYDQGKYVKKVIQIRIQGYVWTDVPKDERHARANVILDTFFNPDNDIAEAAVLPDGGIQFAQDEAHWSLFQESVH